MGYLVSSMGAGNVVYGTDFPWDMGDYSSISMIKATDAIKAGDKGKILGETSARLFRVRA